MNGESPTIRILKIAAIIFQVAGISAFLLVFAVALNGQSSGEFYAILLIGSALVSGIGVVVWLLCDIAQSLRIKNLAASA